MADFPALAEAILVFKAGAKRQGSLARRLMAFRRFNGQEFGQELRSLAIRQHASQARRKLHEFGRGPVRANFTENREGHGKVGKATPANHPARVFHGDGSKHRANFPRRVVLDRPQPFTGHADSPSQSVGRELLLHDERLKRGHDPLASVDRQTNFASRKPFKPFLDQHLRRLDVAKFVGSLDRHRPFHRRLPQVGDFHDRSWLRFPFPSHLRVFAAFVNFENLTSTLQTHSRWRPHRNWCPLDIRWTPKQTSIGRGRRSSSDAYPALRPDPQHARTQAVALHRQIRRIVEARQLLH